jgi:hypothetical protein
MLEQLFPFRHAQYQSGAAASILEEFAAWLINAGYSRSSTRGHVQRLKRVLGRRRSMPPHWSPAQVNRAFSAVPGQPAPLRTTGKIFQRYLKARGQLVAEADQDSFSGLLACYEWHLVQMCARHAGAFKLAHRTHCRGQPSQLVTKNMTP